MKGLTKSEKACLIELELHQEAFGETPDYSTLCRELGFKSKSSIHRILSSLASRGYVKMPDNNHYRVQLLRTVDGLPAPSPYVRADEDMVPAQCWLFDDGQFVRVSDALLPERRS